MPGRIGGEEGIHEVGRGPFDVGQAVARHLGELGALGQVVRQQVGVPERLPAGRDQLVAELLVTGDPHPAQVGQDRRRGALRRDARLAQEQIRVHLSVPFVVVVATDGRACRVQQHALVSGTLDDGHGAHRRRRGRS